MNKISTWFDTLKEPYRFIVFAYFVFGAFFPFGLAMLVYKLHIPYAPLVIAALGVLHLVLFYTLAIHRATRK